MSALDEQVETYLARFGLSSFRPGQREVISTVLAGQDCLCVMPTGGGKSLCYQLPAIARPGLTLVVSPLIALMKDQVDQLTARGLRATFINSTLDATEQTRRLDQMAEGAYQLVYVVPERFRSSRFVEALRKSQLRFLAIDEAHCISEWGHDFRPDYARLGRFRKQLGDPPTIALTATATDTVRRDIVELLNLREPRLFVTGFARHNLFYAVRGCSSDRDKEQALLQFLDATPGAGIVYASTRKRCEELGTKIAARTGRPTTVYHAGLTSDERRAAQDDFMQGRTQIAVATLAFGMGIDKADVRFVVHFNLPGSLEAYYQEAGRAGRDGQQAACLLLHSGGDRHIHEFFIESAYPGRDVVKKVYDYLRSLDTSPIEMTQQEIKESLGLQIAGEGIGACEKLLESAGAIERLEASENMAAVRLNSDLPTLVDLLPQQAKVKRQVLRVLERLVGPRRREWCFFPPREMLRELTDFDSTSLSRNLRELAALEAVDYVPPFRGRAIHMRRRDRSFDELQIDFETLERHKAAEYERFEQVVRFARSSQCRQQQIVSYFGQTESGQCGHCDNCHGGAGGGRQAPPRAMTGPVLAAVRIVLSGVARVSRVRRSCGKQLLAQMLCGSASKPVTRNRLDKLSTFGRLDKLTQTEVVQLIDALLVCGLLEQTEIEPFRPVLQLTDRGTQVMGGQGTQALNLPLPDELYRKLASLVSLGGSAKTVDEERATMTDEPGDPSLLARLRAWRDAASKAAGLPAYMVLSNAVLEALARQRPQTEAQLLSVKGIGPNKVRQYAEALLAILAQGEASSQPPVIAGDLQRVLSDKPDESRRVTPNAAPVLGEANGAASSKPRPAPAPEQPARESHYWTWRLLSAGFTGDECAEIRGLAPEVVLDHALRAADHGLEVDAGWLLAPELIDQIQRVVGSGQPTRIRALLEKLPRGTRYEHVQLVLKSRQRRVAKGD